MFLYHAPRRAHDVARLFDERLQERFAERCLGTAAASNPALDVTESATGWTVQIDLPGVAKSDVKVSIDGAEVSVQAQAKPANESPEQAAEGLRPVYRERQVKRFARRLTMPVAVDPSASEARLENGVLTLTLAKKLKAQANELTIN